MSPPAPSSSSPPGGGRAGHAPRPRLGFAGVGWIGRARLEAVARSGLAEVAAVADPAPEAARAAAALAPGCAAVSTLEALLERRLDGVVLATPSALHAEQAERALGRGLAVFCQKPLGRTAAEARRVAEAARAADRLLAVDLSYRHVRGVPELRERVRSGALGRVYAVELAFHNAYGPDKPWYADPRLAGGGCLMDLGVHLVDLALWSLGAPDARVLGARLSARGEPVRGGDAIEDHAAALLEVPAGPVVQLGCSWRLAAGRDCVIRAAFYGTGGAVVLRNLDGSFYDLAVEAYRGTACERLAGPPDDWGGRGAVAFAAALGRGARFDPGIDAVVRAHAVLDAIYARAAAPAADGGA